MEFKFGARSLARLATVHPDLRRVMHNALATSDLDFKILEGVRSRKRQRQLVASGASTSMNSRHLAHPSDGLARAVDVAPYLDGRVSWDWPLCHKLAGQIKRAATEQEVAIEWGGDWKIFKDGPHWQLPRSRYP